MFIAGDVQQRYLRMHAENLRSDGLWRFPEWLRRNDQLREQLLWERRNEYEHERTVRRRGSKRPDM